VQKGIVHDAETSKKYLESYLLNSFLYNDLLAVRLSWEYTQKGNLNKVLELSEVFSASKAPRELRAANEKLGRRFIKILEFVLGENEMFCEMYEKVGRGSVEVSYPVMYGFCTNLLNIGKKEALSAVTYSAASSIINNCAKIGTYQPERRAEDFIQCPWHFPKAFGKSGGTGRGISGKLLLWI